MIVPRTPLLLGFALIALPLAGGSALPGGLLFAVLMGFGAFGVLLAVDAHRGRRQLHSIRVTLPELVRLQRDRAGELMLRVQNQTKRGGALRIGLPLAADFQSPHETLLIELPPAVENSLVRWPLTATRRGRYFLDRCHFETASPLGFWNVRGETQSRAEIRVYPDLFSERKSVAALFLNRGLFGMHVRRQTGQGREFEKLRDYVPGDSSDQIHWKASAKRNHPVTKVFQIERTQEIYVLLDCSRLSARVTGRDSALERFITASLVLGLAAEQQGDTFGLIVFDDKIRSFVRARGGQQHFAACRDALYTVHSRLVSPDFAELSSFVRVRLRKRALLVVLTALDDPVLADTFATDINLVARQHLVFVNMLQPQGAEPIFTQSDPQKLDEMYERLGGHFLWHKLRELGKVLQRRGVQFSLLENEKLSAQLVTQYLNARARQLL